MLGKNMQSWITMSKTAGWDPTVIPGFTPEEGGDLSNFDYCPDPNRVQSAPRILGQLPQGLHDNYPEDHPSIDQQKDEFNHPDFSRETRGHTNGADPNVGGRTG